MELSLLGLPISPNGPNDSLRPCCQTPIAPHRALSTPRCRPRDAGSSATSSALDYSSTAAMPSIRMSSLIAVQVLSSMPICFPQAPSPYCPRRGHGSLCDDSSWRHALSPPVQVAGCRLCICRFLLLMVAAGETKKKKSLALSTSTRLVKVLFKSTMYPSKRSGSRVTSGTAVFSVACPKRAAPWGRF